MSDASDPIDATEHRLAQVEAMQQKLDEMHRALTAYRDVLSAKLARLQQLGPTADEPAAPPAAKVPLTIGAGSERRSAPRRRGNPVPVLLTNAAASMEPFQGWVLDRSQGGLRLLVDQAVSSGTVLSVRPAKAHASFPWLQVRVRNCQPERSSWSLGVQFLSKPAWGELQAFG